jgi:hypothetical protein
LFWYFGQKTRVKSDFHGLFPEKIDFARISRSILLKIESVGLPILFTYGRSYHGGIARAPLDGSDAA